MDIEIRQLSKSYGGKKVWDGLSLTLPEGQCTALMGPSGCGKTTLLRILMGLDRQDSGTIEGVPPRISAVFQEDRLCTGFSPVENVRIAMPGRSRTDDIREHLTRLGLGNSLDKPVESLSGGMKRRVAIARAYLAPSQMIFLDEPLHGLDDETKQAVIAWMQEMRQGRTVLLVTHDQREAELLGSYSCHPA